MDQTMARFRREFFLEAREILDQIGEDILRLEADPTHAATLNAVFRGMHTIKGSAGTFELIEISEFAHHLESLLNDVREGRMRLAPEVIDLILAGMDLIGAQIMAYESGDPRPDAADLVRQISAAAAGAGKPVPGGETSCAESHPRAPEDAKGAEAPCGGERLRSRLSAAGLPEPAIRDLTQAAAEGARVYAATLRYTSELMENGFDPAVLLGNLHAASRVYHAVTRTSDIPPVADFEPLCLYLHPVVYLAADLAPEALMDLCLDPTLMDIADLTAQDEADPEMVPGLSRQDAMAEFLIGASEWAEAMEQAAIAFEQGGDETVLNAIFRCVHNIKGDATFMGFSDLAGFAHAFESLLERLRGGGLARSAEVVDVVLQAIDIIRKTIHRMSDHQPAPDFGPVLDRLNTLAPAMEKGRKSADSHKTDGGFPQLSRDMRGVFLEQLSQFVDVLRHNLPDQPQGILEERGRRVIRRCLASLKTASSTIGHQVLHRLAEAGLGVCPEGDAPAGPAALGELTGTVTRIAAYVTGLDSGPKRLGEILVAQGRITESELDDTLARQKPIGEILVDDGKITREDLSDALTMQDFMETAAHVESAAVVGGRQVRTMRVDETKVESFTNLVGEMLIARNAYAYLVQQLESGDGKGAGSLKMLKENLHLFSRLTNDIQHGVLALRMIPVRGIFQKFQRVVRDISRKQKKFIQLETGGDDIEIDKKVADILSDPMVHLVRNACDHGIEPPMARKKAGKAEKGTVLLRASREGGTLCIRIIDDGRGINRARLLEKAREKGLSFSSPDDPGLLDLIFMPGLSTSSEITDISGRGVGMDVVKTTVESLGGKVFVTSREGQGTEIILNMPTSLGIETVLFIEVGRQSYALPITNVVETLKVSPARIRRAGGRRLFHHRGEVIAVFHLKHILDEGAGGERTQWSPEEGGEAELPLVVIRTLQGKYGLVVTRLEKNMEIAVKPVPPALSGIDAVSGVSIMGDGRVLLLLNPEHLI